MGTTEKYRLLATLVRGFFEAYASGIVDCHIKEPRDKFLPQNIKRLMVEHYERIADVFHDTLFYPIAVMNYDYEKVEEIVRKAGQRLSTMQELMKTICATKEMHEAMIAEYKRNFELLLSGRYSTIPEQLKNYTRQEGVADTISTDIAIILTVRTVMTAYARGVRSGGTGKVTLHQPTLFRLLFDSITVLLCDAPFAVSEVDARSGLGGLFMKVCRSQHNFDVMTTEMERTYTDLVKNEGIIAYDDKSN